MTIPKVVQLNHEGKRIWQIPNCYHMRTDFPNTVSQKLQRCKRKVAWAVDNVELCTHHAGMRVLVALTK